MKDANILVAVESVVHKTLGDVVRKIYQEHGLLVESANFHWLDVSSAVGENFRLESVSIVESSRERVNK